MIACIIMYITATTHYFLVFRGLLLDSTVSAYFASNALACAAALGPGTWLGAPMACEQVPDTALVKSFDDDCTPSILLLVNVSNFIFLYIQAFAVSLLLRSLCCRSC